MSSRSSGAASPAALTWLGRLSTLLVLVLLAWLCAQIFWAISTPATQRPALQWETDAPRAAQMIGARHLFGVAPSGPMAGAASSDIRLSGVIAAQTPGQPALALLAFDGKPPQVVREGEDVAPGIKLQRVFPRQVELLRAGQVQTLDLPERGKP